MTPRALTPLFRCLERWFPAGLPQGVSPYPAPVSGNHSGEAWFLTIATILLTGTWAVPVTVGIPALWLRLPLIALILFFLPHLIMALIALVSPWFAGKCGSREMAQDWVCLIFMTIYAAAQCRGGGWVSWVCASWLSFSVLNLLLWLGRKWLS